jgi:hypothetical protein
MPNIGQVTYQQFPSFAVPGQLADLAYNEVQSFPAAETIPPGRAVEMASDGLSVQLMQQTSSTVSGFVGFSVLLTARESSGPLGVSPFGVGGVSFQKGEMVPVLMRGRAYVEWKGTTQTNFSMPNVYHSSTTATDRGKLTDASTSTSAGSEVANIGHYVRVRQALPGGGDIVLVDVNLPGAA